MLLPLYMSTFPLTLNAGELAISSIGTEFCLFCHFQNELFDYHKIEHRSTVFPRGQGIRYATKL